MYEEDDHFYRKIFRDICLGYTKVNQDDKTFFVKHFHSNDYLDFTFKEKYFLEKAVKRGIPTEAESLKQAKDGGLWTDKDESFIDSQEYFVENLKKTKVNLNLKSERDAHQKVIDEEEQKLFLKKQEKVKILGSTAESYASKQMNDFFITSAFYSSPEFKQKLFSEDVFNEMSYSEIAYYIKINNSLNKVLNEDTIQRVVLEEFFFPFMYLCEKPTELFGKAAVDLTNNQLSILTYSRVFKNVLDNNSDIPDKIRKDPDALLEYAKSSKSKEKMKEHLDKDGVSTVFGATKEDYEYMGVDSSSVRGSDSLSNMAKKKGGSLNMDDLMKLT